MEQLVCMSSLHRLHLAPMPAMVHGLLSLCSRLPSLTSLTIDVLPSHAGVPSQEMLTRLTELRLDSRSTGVECHLHLYRQQYLQGDAAPADSTHEALAQRVRQACAFTPVVQEWFQSELAFREGT